MKTKAVRLYGKEDLRLEEFELPAIKDDEILAHVISDSICMSSFKAAEQGADHKRVPNDVAENPIIIGHEFCGEIVEVGKKWQNEFSVGQKFSIQPALNQENDPYAAPGYSFKHIGGDATYIIIPAAVMEHGCLLKYNGDAYFYGSVAEPMSCIVGGYHANYHIKQGTYVHDMGIVEGGCTAILAGVGPMGMGAIDYALHAPLRPSILVVTDIDTARLERAASIYTVEEAAKNGVKLYYVNTNEVGDADEYLMNLTNGHGFDDVFVFAPVKPVVEQGDRILAKDGCLNFFAGPIDPKFSAMFNFYNVHYAATHIVGTSGGNTDDMKESLLMMEQGKINPAAMITHIGGLNAVIETTLNLPKIPGGKKLIYTNIDLPLTAITDFAKAGETDPMFKKLDEIVSANNGLWCIEAEKFLLANAKSI
ncbi:MAG: L-sorbose 1-phosphate reductase [Clostridiales bacterium]|nr:MAG: L-sorbose 1-phosphate reductase [Clostridiales bacterium]